MEKLSNSVNIVNTGLEHLRNLEESKSRKGSKARKDGEEDKDTNKAEDSAASGMNSTLAFAIMIIVAIRMF